MQSGAGLALFETLDSTSLEAKRRAAAGARGSQWIVALEQTAGYGRRGARWEQRTGDVAATLLFESTGPPETLGQLSFVAALAVADSLDGFAPNAPLALKWPNDVLAGGGKIAGVLLELIDAKPRPLIAIGIGVNIVSKPDAVLYPTARVLDFADQAPSPVEFVERLDGDLAHWMSIWTARGFNHIRSAWLAKAAGLGAPIRVQLPHETIDGVFLDLAQDGALVLDCEGKRRLIAAGAVLPRERS